MGTPIVGIGPVSLGGTALSNMAKWSVDLDFQNEEVKDLAAAVKQQVAVTGSWGAKVEFELPIIGRNLGAIACAGWNGIEVNEWSLEASVELKECEGQADLWRRYMVKPPLEWTFEAEKWVVTDSYNVFVAAAKAQVATAGYLLAVTTPYGTGTGLCEKLPFAGDGEPAKEKITVKAASTFVGIEARFAALLETVNALLTTGVATPQTFAASYGPSAPLGSGNAWTKSVKVTAAKGPTKIELDLQGTGEFA